MNDLTGETPLYSLGDTTLSSIYMIYIIMVSLNIFSMGSMLNNGKFLTLVANGKSPMEILLSLFLWSVIYTSLLNFTVFSIFTYYVELRISDLFIIEFLLALIGLNVFCTGLGYLISVTLRVPIVSAGAILSFFIFISPQIFDKYAQKNLLSATIAGFENIRLGSRLSGMGIEGCIMEITLGIIFFIVSSYLLRFRSIKPLGR
ncbi:MAG: hypothetical protein M1496_07765 [Candidatus Thermoplasmatota archaeon]|jgi:hypothetical protein|nr:hypothetical protein [Candidatus Thermoplasmatota archaeon]